MKTNSNEDINNSTEETESRRKGSDVRFLHSGESSSRLNYKAKKDGELDCLNSRNNRKQYTRNKKYSSAINSGSTNTSYERSTKAEGNERNKNSVSIQDKNSVEEDNDSLNDPMAFWSAWSGRRKACFDETGDLTHQASCNCFEGIGRVM